MKLVGRKIIEIGINTDYEPWIKLDDGRIIYLDTTEKDTVEEAMKR